MTISVGESLPKPTMMRLGDNGPEPVELAPYIDGKKVVLFGVPGAFSTTCDQAHMPSFIRNVDAFKAKGVDEIICIATNDPWVMAAWDKATGAGDAGITVLSDASAALTKGMGIEFSAPVVGFNDRCRRFAAFIDNGVVKVLQEEVEKGVCDLTAGEALLDAI
ncbi:peroxiredoxin [Shimia biformata]|uniref:peroxiredoxin n=1 Tax=Shimia biformata TaxID=1294299 RepID=UPI00194F9D50|nr:peroxiredoxin [Shimia biformata]